MRERKYRVFDDGYETPGMFYSDDYESLEAFISTHGFHNICDFIGLDDESGKDIYECDYFEWEGLLHPIVVSEHHGHRYMFGNDQMNKDYAKNGRVIGNIYENPELINGTK